MGIRPTPAVSSSADPSAASTLRESSAFSE